MKMKTKSKNHLWCTTLCHLKDLQHELLEQGFLAMGYGKKCRNYNPDTDGMFQLTTEYDGYDLETITNMLNVKVGDVIAIPRCACSNNQKLLRNFSMYDVVETARGIALWLPDHRIDEHDLGLAIKVKPSERKVEMEDTNCHDPDMGFLKNRMVMIGELEDDILATTFLNFQQWLHDN